MLKKDNLKVGDKVHYQPSYKGEDEFENGIVKVIPEETISSVRIVYNCAGDWENYQNYTSCLTDCRDLHEGWKEKVTNKIE